MATANDSQPKQGGRLEYYRQMLESLAIVRTRAYTEYVVSRKEVYKLNFANYKI